MSGTSAETPREFYFQPDWFEVTQVADRVWAIREPRHFEDVFSYFVQGDTGSVLIDTGMGFADIRKVLPAEQQPPVILTHSHYDHMGSAVDFQDVKVFNDPFETQRLRRGWQTNELRIFDENYFTDENYSLPGGMAENFSIPGMGDFTVLEDGEVIDLGGITLRAIHTPGHTPGSVCYYSEELGALFTGDMIYPAPIYLHMEESDIDAYQASLEKIVQTVGDNLKVIFPGHNAGIADPNLFYRSLAAIRGEVEASKVEEGSDEFGNFTYKEFGGKEVSFLLPR